MYKTWIYITDPVWNNEFSYQERIDLWSKGESPASLGKIFVPKVIQWTVADLEEGSEIVFEEVSNGKLISCTGLKDFIETKYKWIPTYIFDNHNHALFFRYRHTKKLMTSLTKEESLSHTSCGISADADGGFKPFVLLHIDQHADTKENKNSFIATHSSPQEVLNFTNYWCNVGNFLSSAKHAGIIDEIIQIRSEHALHNMEKLDFQNYNYILDIDVDFWVDKSEQEIQSDFKIIKKLTDNVCLITIATSPYFINQKKAIEIIKKLLE